MGTKRRTDTTTTRTTGTRHTTVHSGSQRDGASGSQRDGTSGGPRDGASGSRRSNLHSGTKGSKLQTGSLGKRHPSELGKRDGSSTAPTGGNGDSSAFSDRGVVTSPRADATGIVPTGGSVGKAGASKFHLSAGCTADLPRHRLISDLSVLIPQDYIQFDMEWDPQTFLPELRDYVIPEFHRLQRYGASKVTLAQLQSNIAHSQDTPAWYHSIHFSGNTIATAVIGCSVTLFMCIQSQRRKARERRGQKIEKAVRVALNAGTPRPHYNFPAPLALPMPIVSHPSSTVFVQPVNPHMFDVHQPMSRPQSFTNLTSVSEAAARQYEDQTIPLAPSCPRLSDMNKDNLPGYTPGYQTK